MTPCNVKGLFPSDRPRIITNSVARWSSLLAHWIAYMAKSSVEPTVHYLTDITGLGPDV